MQKSHLRVLTVWLFFPQHGLELNGFIPIRHDRIRQIVLSLRNFSRMDEADFKMVNIHDGIDSTLLILQHRLQAQSPHSEISVIQDYGTLPPVECYAGQLNQVFMNILSNAIDTDYDSDINDRFSMGRNCDR